MLGKGGNFAHLFCCERNSAVKAETSKCRGREFRVVRFFACLKIPEYRTGSFFGSLPAFLLVHVRKPSRGKRRSQFRSIAFRG